MLQPQFPRLRLWRLALFNDPAWPPFAERVRVAEAVQEEPAHVAIRGVVPIVADAMSAIGNRLSVGQDRLLRATLTTPAATADLVRQALQEQTTELTAVLSAAASQRPRVLVVVPPEDIRDGVLEADGLQRALGPVTAAAEASHNTATAAAVTAPPAALERRRRRRRDATCGLPRGLSGGASPRERRLHGDAPAGVVRGAGRVAVGAGVGGAVGGPLAVHLRPPAAVLRPEKAGEVDGSASGGGGGLAGSSGGGNGPFGPVAGQVLPGIGQGAGSPCERSAEIDINIFIHSFLPKSYIYLIGT